MRTTSMKSLEQKMKRHCSRCGRKCKADSSVIRVFWNPYMSPNGSQIDIYCNRSTTKDFVTEDGKWRTSSEYR